MAEFGWQSAKSVHVMAEAMRHAFVDRNFRLGDPAFVTNPLDQLLSEDYAAQIRAAIDMTKAARSSDVQPGTPPHGGTQTTHYSIVDAAGQCRGRHLHHQRAVRRQGHRRGYRLLPQRRDG